MKLKKIQQDFSICMIADVSELDLTKQFCFVGKTDEELSLVCAVEDVPEHTLSTYRTDYVLVKKEQYQQALETLAGAGYEIV